MVKVRIKTQYKGKVAIRDKYLKLAKKEGLHLKYKDEEMIIPAKHVTKSIDKIGKEWYKDQYSGDIHQLVYFKWNPKQQKLF